MRRMRAYQPVKSSLDADDGDAEVANGLAEDALFDAGMPPLEKAEDIRVEHEMAHGWTTPLSA